MKRFGKEYLDAQLLVMNQALVASHSCAFRKTWATNDKIYGMEKFYSPTLFLSGKKNV